MDTFFRLIHVSDFHLGDSLYPQGVGGTPSGQLKVNVPSLEVHDLAVLEALSNSVMRAYQTDPSPVRIIITGDLTTFGTAPAFDLAFNYIRSLISLGGTQQIGFNASDSLVVPGNHDCWGSATVGAISGMASSNSSRSEFEQRFDSMTSLISYAQNGNKFPYRAHLNDSPLIYLYGLDSSRLDAYAGSQHNSLSADGFVDNQQLSDLEALVKDEPATPRLRIAALHHTLMRPVTVFNNLPKGNLLNKDEVLLNLQQLGFGLVLCGHLHESFSGSSNSTPLIHIVAAGTSAQNVHLSVDEKRLLSPAGSFLSPGDKKLRMKALKRTNEYKTYEFKSDAKIQNSLAVEIHTYCYVPKLAAFEKIIAHKLIQL